MSHGVESPASSPSPTRRTLLTGAAWSVPAIAVASVAPVATASTGIALTFTPASYSAAVCGTVNNVSVTVTNAGQQASGVVVTTTLSGGAKFAGGSTEHSGVTNSLGKLQIPAITAAAKGGTATITSTPQGGTPTVTTLTSPSGPLRAFSVLATNTTSYASVPTTATPLGAPGWFLLNGTLYDGNTIRETGVTSLVAGVESQLYFVNFMKGGVACSRAGNNGRTTWSLVPSTATPLSAYGWFLGDGKLYSSNALIDSNVTAAAAGGNSVTSFANYIKGGVAYTKTAAGQLSTWTGVPGTAVPLSARGWFLNAGDLYDGNSLVDTGVTAAVGGQYGSTPFVNYSKGGVAYLRRGTSFFQTFPGVPSTAVPTAGYATFYGGDTIYYFGGVWLGGAYDNTQIPSCAFFTNGNDPGVTGFGFQCS